MQVEIILKSPLSHGSFDGPIGSNQKPIRREAVCIEGFPEIPVITGNAVRGVMRRLIMREFFTKAGLDRELFTEKPELWDRLYAALCNGGHLEDSSVQIKPSVIRELREELPMLSVLGAALYRLLLPGRVRPGFFWLSCLESAEAGLVPDDPGLSVAEDYVGSSTLSRHIERGEQDPELSGVTPMPRGLEVVKTGAKFYGRVDFLPEATDLERSCIAWGLSKIEWLGGISAAGYGNVEINTLEEVGPELFEDWLDSDLDAAKNALISFIGEVGPTTKKSKKGKKAAKKKDKAEEPVASA